MRNPDRENNPCPACNGKGYRHYSNTSTWRGGIGGQAITADICDICWGSGDKTQPFTDQRQQEEYFKRKIKEATIEDWIKQAGCDIKSVREILPEIIEAIEKLTRKRKPAPNYWKIQTYGIIIDIFKRLVVEDTMKE